MNLMFLNSLEKRLGDNQRYSAQVTISESQGIWFVEWQETAGEAELYQESWYEGTGWEDMLHTFRTRIYTKMSEGFKPILNVSVEQEAVNGRSAQVQLLHYYSELHTNEELYEQLRQWRLKQAGLDGKAPFLVATNRLLRLLCAFLPHSQEELQQLPGMGATKAAAYGKELLELTCQYERQHEFPLDWVESQTDPAQFNAWLQFEKDRRRKAELSKQEAKRKLLEAVTRGDSLEALREQTQLQRREVMLSLEELDREGYDLEPYIEQILKDVPEEEQTLAWAAFELKGDRYLKPVLQAVYKREELDGKEVDRIYEWLRLLRMKFRRANAVRRVEAV